MPRTRASIVPRTPGGVHLKLSDISADEIEFDDEIAIKSSVFRGMSDSPPPGPKMCRAKSVKSTPKNKTKFILRKSTDLRKIKKIDDKIEAILASPMIEVRRRPAGQSRSFTSDLVDFKRTPIQVPSSKDLAAVSSRRMSAIVMSRFAPFAHSMSLSEGDQVYECPTALNRRKTAGNSETPIRYPACSNLNSPRCKNTPITPVVNSPLHEVPKPMDVDNINDLENMPPKIPVELRQNHQVPSTLEAEQTQNTIPNEPTSVGDFRVLVRMEASRLSSAKAAWEDVMTEEGCSIPESAVNSIRAAVGKCGLLLSKKFPFFSSLVDLTENSLRHQKEEELTPQQRASINDLLGMWTIISQQIGDIDKSFERLRKWREVAAWTLNTPPVTPARLVAPPRAQSRKSIGSRLPRPIKSKIPTSSAALRRKSKGEPKSLLSSSNKLTASKSRPSTVQQRSNFSLFRQNMLAKKKAMETKEAVEDTSKLVLQNRSSVASATRLKRDPSSRVSAVLMQDSKIRPQNAQRRGASISISSVTPRSLDKRKLPLEAPFSFEWNENDSKIDSNLLNTTTPHSRKRPRTPELNGGTIALPLKAPINASVNTTRAETTVDSFIVPESRPQKRVRKDQASLSTLQISAVTSTPNPFSPPPRPATGTPKPQLARYLKATPDVSLQRSLLSKKLMLAVTCGNSCMSSTSTANPTSRKRKSVHFPKLALASTPNGHAGGSGSPRESLPVTPYASLIGGPSRRVSQRIRRQQASTSLQPS